MEQANLEASEQFQKNNGMSIDEAYEHVKNWYAEGQYNEVIDGCEEIMQYIPDYKDVAEILRRTKEEINASNQPAGEPTMSQEPTMRQEQTGGQFQEPHQTVEKKKEEMYTGSVTKDEKIISALGYLGFLCVLPLLLKKDSKYCQFHGKQALVLAVIFFFYKYLAILRDFPFVGGMIQFMLGIVLFLELLIIIFAMLQAFRGKYWKIPVIAGFAEKLKF